MTLHSCAVNFTARRCAAHYSLWRAAAIAGARASAACFAACASACGRMGVGVWASGRVRVCVWASCMERSFLVHAKARADADAPETSPRRRWSVLLSPPFPHPASPHTLRSIPAKSFLPHALALSLAVPRAHTRTHTHAHARSPMLSLVLWLGVATNIRACCDSAMITLQSRCNHAVITL
jgi:hypothetical protein